MNDQTETTRRVRTSTVDRDTPCVCGSIAARQLCDGSIECISCGHVTADPFVVAKRTLGTNA